MDIFQIESCICIMFYNKDKEKVTIGYSYLLVGTHSATKFEKVPSTNEYTSPRHNEISLECFPIGRLNGLFLDGFLDTITCS